MGAEEDKLSAGHFKLKLRRQQNHLRTRTKLTAFEITSHSVLVMFQALALANKFNQGFIRICDSEIIDVESEGRMSEAKAKAIVLSDQPADEDRFHGGGHLRSAKALAHAVEQLADEDGAIGLEGPWGSGKSTVINLASQHFSTNGAEKRQHHIFTFDLWLHHPETLKLGFLEEFIAWARAEKFLSQRQHDHFMERVSDREIKTRLENKREFSLSGILFILLLPLLPLAYTWLSPLAFSNRTGSDDSTSVGSTSIFSLGDFAVTPIGIAVGGVFTMYLIYLLFVIWKRVGGKSNNVKAAMSAGVRLFSRETDYDEIRQFVRERNTTSEGFQSFFREILSAVQKKGRRIVFVFDNIDRLPTKAVQKVWSECRSIFAMKSHGAQPENSTITAIVPYDAEYITAAFSDQETDDLNRGENLIRKTFGITIRVAPPLSTDWNELLQIKLDEAFPTALPDKTKYQIFKLLDIHGQVHRELPTPRNIITYVNNIASVWNQWGDVVDASHIALYVLLRREIEAQPNSLKQAGFPNERVLRVLRSDDVIKNLAALHYNVEPEHAYQVLLGQDVQRLAIGSKTESFVELSTSVGFREVFPDIVLNRIDDWAREDAEAVSNLAANMAHDDVQGAYLEEAWHHMAEATAMLAEGHLPAIDDYMNLKLIVERNTIVPAQRAAEHLIDWVSKSIPEENARSASDGEKWFAFFNEVHSSLSSTFGSDAADRLNRRTIVPKSPAFCLGVCAASFESGQIDFNKFDKSNSESEIRPKLVELSNNDLTLLESIVQAQPWFLTLAAGKELAEKLCERLLAKDLPLTDLSIIVRTLTHLRLGNPKVDSIFEPVKTRVSDGTLVAQAARAIENDMGETVGALIWLIVESNESSVPNNPGTQPNFGDLTAAFAAYEKHLGSLDYESLDVGEVARLVVKAKDFAVWQKYAVAKNAEGFFQSVLERIIEDDDFNNLHVTQAVTAYDRLSEFLSDDHLIQYLKALTRWSEYFDSYFSGSDALKIPSNLLRKGAELEIQSFEVLGKCVDKELDAYQSEDWTEVLSGENDAALELFLVRMLTSDYKPPLDPYREALQSHTSDLLDGEVQVSDHANEWPELFRGLRTNTLQKLARDILVNLKSATTTKESVEHFLEVCGPVADLFPLSDYPDNTVDHILVPVLGSSKSTVEAFVTAKKDDFRSAVRAASEPSKGRLVEVLEDIRNNDAAGTERAERLAKLFDVTLPPVSEEDDSDCNEGEQD